MAHGCTLHLMPASSRNTTRLISFMEEMSFEHSQRFFIHGDFVNRVKFSDSKYETTFLSGGLYSFLKRSRDFFSADKIIVHGFFNVKLMLFFFIFPKLLKRVYWVVWGGDLYSFLVPSTNPLDRLRRKFLRSVLGRIQYVVTYIPGDYKLVKELFNPDAQIKKSLMYPGNLFKKPSSEMKAGYFPDPRILVGNSGAPSNNHLRIFKRLKENRDLERLKIYCPLSYGDPAYIEEVRQAGHEYFGENFVALEDYMDMEEYVRFLQTIKYAVFDYDRQQGMGNIISLLGLGKGVFLNPNTTPWQLFRDADIDVLDVNRLAEYDLKSEFVSENVGKVENRFSKEVLEEQLYDVFD